MPASALARSKTIGIFIDSVANRVIGHRHLLLPFDPLITADRCMTTVELTTEEYGESYAHL